jgi:hypothetical protein
MQLAQFLLQVGRIGHQRWRGSFAGHGFRSWIARILGDRVPQVLLAFAVDLQVSIDEIHGIDDAYAAATLISELETAA